jgi:hypothetical protein
MFWLLLAGGALVALIVAEKKTTASQPDVLPDLLPSTGQGGSGTSAGTQELQTGITAAATAGGDLATGNIGGAVAAGVSGLITSLTQHSARLAAAKAENSAIPPAVQAFDADLKAIAGAYSAGQLTPAQAASALAALDQNIYGNLHGLVGKPGTAWNVPAQTMTSDVGATCNTSCTVSCCVYNNDLHSPLVAAYEFLLYYAGQGLNVDQVNANARPWLNSNYGGNLLGNGFILGVPAIEPPDDPAYGNFSRPAYSVQFAQSNSLPLTTLASVI